MLSKNQESLIALKNNKDGKFFSRMLTKENSSVNSSSRLYFGMASVTVPFEWESQPGTPKHRSSETNLPPLTPPPPYYKKESIKKPTKPHMFKSVLPKLTRINSQTSSISSSLSSSSSSSSSSAYSQQNLQRQGRLLSLRSSCSSGGEEDYEAIESPTSTLCFGFRRIDVNRRKL